MISLRRATLADAQPLYDWRMDPVTMENSRSTESFTLDSHTAWLTTKLKDSNLFIAELQGTPIGMGRLDTGESRCCGQYAEVSLIVAPEHRGRHYGRAIIEWLVTIANSWGCRHLFAETRAENLASLTSFFWCGFVVTRSRVDATGTWVRVERTL